MRKVFIANRAEIAVRIQRACSVLGLQYVQAASEVDLIALAARNATEIGSLGGRTAQESYLNIPAVIAAAKRHGCDAIHPGYGFLSESSQFARATQDAGLVFIGPRPDCIEALGHKTNARTLVRAAGVPTTVGSEGGLDDTQLLQRVASTGFPIIIKAVAGGGGRGMRVAHNVSEFAEALPRARAEALKNFGNESVYFERFVDRPRHIEVQLFGDNHGNVCHLGTRECSAQRRHQKLIEEGPAPNLSPELRQKIETAAVRAAMAVNYNNAGTAEFLVQGDDFFFLEINTRIQVEHPVTEMITGRDLVQTQIRVAMGEPLDFRQEDVEFGGHAIELRINAEDAQERFRPVTGRISAIDRVSASWLREDFGYERGDEVSPYYDSLLSKLIISGRTRDEAIYRAYHTAHQYVVEGIETSLPFHRWMLATLDFQRGGFDIGFVEREFSKESLASIEANCIPGFEESKGNVQPQLIETYTQPNGRLVRVVAEPGGTFLGIPLDYEGKIGPKSEWRRSTAKVDLLSDF